MRYGLFLDELGFGMGWDGIYEGWRMRDEERVGKE